MNDEEFPALYQAADAASVIAQRTYLNCIKGYAALSIFSAGLAAYGIESKTSAVLAAIVLLAALFLSVLMAFKKFENGWYRARAVAESVKTSSWRFMMRAEPFQSALTPADVRAKFRAILQKILGEHHDLAHDLAGTLSGQDQITEEMLKTRELPLDERIGIFRNERIKEQRTWYAKKSTFNKTQGRSWFVFFIVLQSGAIIFAVLRVAYPEWKYWPIQIFIVAATSIFGWIQVKRFRELAAAYGLTAHEIGLAENELDDVRDEEQFSRFVGDTENAFSREHTQWIARKD